jgi:hypothetical protein
MVNFVLSRAINPVEGTARKIKPFEFQHVEVELQCTRSNIG